MKAIDPSAEIRYVPVCDRDLPKEEQTVFIIRPMTAKQAAKIQDSLVEQKAYAKNEQVTSHINSGSQILNALEAGLVGWENFKLPNGQDIPWRDNNGKPRPENFDHIPRAVRKELAEVIIEGQEVSEDDEKK